MRLIISCLILFSFSASTAQDSLTYPQWSVTVKPLGIIDPFLPNLMGGVQCRINEKFAVELNAGVIRSLANVFSSDDESEIKITGFKLSGEVKYFMLRNFYFSLQLFYNDYLKTNKEYVWRYAEQYQQELKIKKFKTVTGGHLKAGYVIRQRKKLFFEAYGGIGIRFRNTRIKGYPEDATLIRGTGLLRDKAGNEVLPSVSFGGTIGYRF